MSICILNEKDETTYEVEDVSETEHSGCRVAHLKCSIKDFDFGPELHQHTAGFVSDLDVFIPFSSVLTVREEG